MQIWIGDRDETRSGVRIWIGDRDEARSGVRIWIGHRGERRSGLRIRGAIILDNATWRARTAADEKKPAEAHGEGAGFRTDGVSLFVQQADRLLNVSADGQTVLREVLEASLQRIDWEGGLAARLYPWIRGGAATLEPRTIVIDPRRGFGQPIIAGTGIEARTVAGRYRAGESILVLAEDYGVGLEQVEDAIRCETREAA